MKPAHRKRVIDWVALPLIAAAAAAVSMWLMVVDRLPPYDLVDATIAPQNAEPLQRITVRRQIVRVRNIPHTATCVRDITDSAGTIHRVNDRAIDEPLTGTSVSTAVSVIVPLGASLGSAYYSAKCCYMMHSIVSLTSVFQVCRNWPRVPFQIIPPDRPLMRFK